MKVFILFLLGLLCNSADITTCNCTQLKTEFDCSSAYYNQIMTQDLYNVKGCVWNDGKCIDVFDYESSVDCSQIVDQSICSNIPFCAWFYGQCSKFTKCQDYTFDSSVLSTQCETLNCLDNGTTCVFDLLGRTEQTCEELNTQDNCENVYILYKSTVCTWSGSACTGNVLKSCSALTQSQCNQASAQCSWNGSACQKRTCADGAYAFYHTSGTKICTSYVDIETSSVVYCNLNTDGLCVEMDPSEYDRRNCFPQSFSQYRWVPSSKTCEKC